MKVLVTGANGYLGQGVVKALLENGHSVVAADFKTTHGMERRFCALFGKSHCRLTETLSFLEANG